jgi:hypothetical protein
MQADAFFRISKVVRYVALYLDGQLTLRERPGLANASASESTSIRTCSTMNDN